MSREYIEFLDSFFEMWYPKDEEIYRRDFMKITLNENEEIVKMIKDGLAKTGGYCPCRLERTEENKCMCKEFKDQIKDPDFEGFCHCMLYYKSK